MNYCSLNAAAASVLHIHSSSNGTHRRGLGWIIALFPRLFFRQSLSSPSSQSHNTLVQVNYSLTDERFIPTPIGGFGNKMDTPVHAQLLPSNKDQNKRRRIQICPLNCAFIELLLNRRV